MFLRLHLLFAMGTVGLVLPFPTSVRAYVRQTVDGSSRLAVFWPFRRILIHPAYSTNEMVPQGALQSAVLRSMSTWEAAGGGCTDVSLIEGAPPAGLETSMGRKGMGDGENRLVWHEDDWEGSPQALAVTTLVYRRSTGEIIDADIDVNDVNYEWTATDPPGDVLTDVQNALTHEIGHFLGFAHELDMESTMYGSTELGEIRKRDLTTDDAKGMCDVYPEGKPTPRDLGAIQTGLISETGCSVSRSHAQASAARIMGFSIALIALFFRRFRRLANRAR